MKVKYSIAILLALYSSSSQALRLTDEDDYGYPFGTPYNSAELRKNEKEVSEAAMDKGFQKQVVELKQKKKEVVISKAQLEKEETLEFNRDAQNPSHNQGKTF